MPGSSRRRVLTGLGALLAVPAAGCGFEPLHGDRGSGAVSGAVATELAAVRIGLVPERNGQLLRRAVQQRLEQGGGGVAARYDLRVALQLGLEPQGFRRDGTPTRQRATLVAPWSLYAMAVPPVLIGSGAERAFDAYNVPDNQFFASDASADAMTRRLIDRIAADIVQSVALTLRDRSGAATG